MIREPIDLALFDLWSGAPGLVTISRKLKLWKNVPANQRPALFQAKKSETAIRTTGQPTRWMIEYDIWLYVSTAGDVSPDTALNPILDFIEAQLAEPFPGTSQTLNGLVQYARIEGMTEIFEGTLGSDEIAVVPVSILTA